jgi:hypothetical protein
MTFFSSINETLRYLALVILCTSALLSSCSSKSLLKTHHQIENYKLHFSELGIEPADYAGLSEQEWWESFFQYCLGIEASTLGYYLGLEHDTELHSLVELIESRGNHFYSDELGVVMYLTLGDNSKPVADVSYFRLFNLETTFTDRQLELLVEKGVEVAWADIPGGKKVESSLDEDTKNQGKFWILYRFKISILVGDHEWLFNRAFTLSCDKHYCLTRIDRTRQVLFLDSKGRYDDLIIQGSEGYQTIEKLFESAVAAYNAHQR